MGTEIPLVEYDKTTNTPTYAYYSTKMSLDEAKAAFEKVKELSIRLSMVENAAIRLAANIKKTQKRAKCSEEYHYSEVRGTDQRYPECTGGERT